MLTVAFQTLGCKLNQTETEALASAFASAGFPVSASSDDAALLVVNTCAVTSRAEQKARSQIRCAIKRNPGCRVLVTGCYAQTDRDGVEALDDGDGDAASGDDDRRVFVVPGAHKSRLLELPDYLKRTVGEVPLRDALASFCAGLDGDRAADSGEGDGKADTSVEAASPFAFDTSSLLFHSRVFLKVQDGCDNFCAYCVVPLARGAPVSLAPERVLERARAAEKRSAEAVLTGVNISRYSGVLGGAAIGLGGLLSCVLGGTSTLGLRLSSLEPHLLDDAFFEAAADGRVMPHFHLSVQSGSGEVLRRMGRRYAPEDVLRVIERLRAVKDDPFIACDIIAGFPGETERHFADTLDLCRQAGFARIHAFPFSRRRGTAAWDYKPRIPEREAVRRVKALNALSDEGRKTYVARWIGRETGGIALSADDSGILALTDNYLRLRVPLPVGSQPQRGQRLRCRIIAAAECPIDADAVITLNESKG